LTHDEIEQLVDRLLADMEVGDAYTKTLTPNDETYVQLSVYKLGEDSYQYQATTVRSDIVREELAREAVA
jgi:hypothetical protein